MEKKTSIQERAYQAIKHRIITCEFEPGAYLNAAQVSSLLNLGRTPVHQAFVRLTGDGLVEILPRKGIIVRPIDLAEVLQITSVRLINEAVCVRLAAERATADEIKAMSDIVEKADVAVKRRSIEEMMLLDRDFHNMISHAAKNTVLADILKNLHERSLRLWFISLTSQEQQANVQDDHRQILSAIKAGDPDGAEVAMRNHIEASRRNLVSQSEAF